MPESRVLIAIVTHNSDDVIEQCLRGFDYLATSAPLDAEIEIIVADNASTDRTVARVRAFIRDHPSMPILLVESPWNYGWGGGNNLAIAQRTVDPDFVLLCNPDAGIDRDNLVRLLHGLQRAAPKAAIAVPFVRTGSQIEVGANPEWGFLKFAVWDLFGNKRSQRRFQNRYRSRSGTFELESAYASGALALVSFSALSAVGFFDERIFLFNDDIDMTRAILGRGHSLIANADAVGLHVGGRGSRIENASPGTTAATLASESELVFVEKWYGKHWARALAFYRYHCFFRLQWFLLWASRKPAFDIEPHRRSARGYLKAASHP